MNKAVYHIVKKHIFPFKRLADKIDTVDLSL